MAITKTDFMRGMQCRKMLWLDKHKPGLRVIPPEVQARLDAGNDFGDRAMGMFGPYEEMTVYLPGKQIPDKKAMIQKTQEHLAKGTPVNTGDGSLCRASAGADGACAAPNPAAEVFTPAPRFGEPAVRRQTAVSACLYAGDGDRGKALTAAQKKTIRRRDLPPTNGDFRLPLRGGRGYGKMP